MSGVKDCAYCHGDHEYFAHCPECMKLECEDPQRCADATNEHIEGLMQLVKDRHDIP